MDNRKSEEEMQGMLKQTRDTPVPDEVKARLQAHLTAFRRKMDAAEAARFRPVFRLWSWRSVAAVASFAAILLLFLFSNPLRKGNSGISFADVLEQLKTFRPYSWTDSIQYENKPALKMRVMKPSLSVRREIREDGSIYVFDLQAGKTLQLLPEKKYARLTVYTEDEPKQDPDLLAMIGQLQDGTQQELGKRKIDGTMATGFKVPGGMTTWTVWVDPETCLPVRVELDQETKPRRKIVMSDFDFAPAFDESLFNMEPPEGYAVEKIVRKRANPTERSFIEGLRFLSEFLGGRFPSSLEGSELAKELADRVKELGGSRSNEETDKINEYHSEVTRYVQILKGFTKVENFSYVGGTVTPGDKSAPILWYREKGSKTYRVIYGDLSACQRSSEELPDSTSRNN
ncbi:MAG TPA: DUF2092 domain-containing protein [bacterium]|nr:DUF2092 domain-containing protein [bacterium]